MHKKLRILIEFIRNDIKSKYANSVLGIMWAFAMPLVTILVFWYVFQLGFKNLPIRNMPYILWFSAAYVPWIFFVDITTSGCNSLVEYSYLVKKIKFDIEFIPIVKVMSALFVHLFFALFLFGMYLLYGYNIEIHNIQMFYYTFALGMFGLALVWLLSAVNVFFKDVNSLYNIFIQIGFWVTPILWNEDAMANDMVKRVLACNPIHYIVNGYRDSLLFKKWFWEKPYETIYFWGITVIIWFIGRMVFKKLRPFMADEV